MHEARDHPRDRSPDGDWPTNLAIVVRLPTENSVRSVKPIVVTYEGLASRKGSATADHWIETLCLRMLGNGDGTARFIMLDSRAGLRIRTAGRSLSACRITRVSWACATSEMPEGCIDA